MTPRLRLRVRTPAGLVLDREVRAVRAEDLDGAFGIRPGRTDLVAVLPAGVLAFDDDEGETFVAVSGGLLDLERGECRVTVRDAAVTRDPSELGTLLEAAFRERRARIAARGDVIAELEREVLRRLAQESRA